MPVSSIESGGMDVFDSGTVTAFGDEPIRFTLEHAETGTGTDTMELVFEFVEDGGDPDFETEVVDREGKARFLIRNHLDGVDVGPDGPFNVGVLAGRALHLIYHVNAISRDDGHVPILSYTFYLGKAVGPGEVDE